MDRHRVPPDRGHTGFGEPWFPTIWRPHEVVDPQVADADVPGICYQQAIAFAVAGNLDVPDLDTVSAVEPNARRVTARTSFGVPSAVDLDVIEVDPDGVVTGRSNEQRSDRQRLPDCCKSIFPNDRVAAIGDRRRVLYRHTAVNDVVRGVNWQSGLNQSDVAQTDVLEHPQRPGHAVGATFAVQTISVGV